MSVLGICHKYMLMRETWVFPYCLSELAVKQICHLTSRDGKEGKSEAVNMSFSVISILSAGLGSWASEIAGLLEVCWIFYVYDISLIPSHLLTGWQLGRNHHSGHWNIRPQLVSRGFGWLREGDGRSSREIKLCTLPSFGPRPRPGPAGSDHPTVLPGVATADVAGAPAGLWYCLWGAVSLAGFQAPHSAAGWLGAVCATGTSLPAQDSSIPCPAGVAHAPSAAFLLAVLWCAHLGFTGRGKYRDHEESRETWWDLLNCVCVNSVFIKWIVSAVDEPRSKPY